MLVRGSFTLMVGALVLASGCAVTGSEIEESVDSTESAIEVDCDTVDYCADDDVAPAATIVTLTSWSASTGALTYLSGTTTRTSFVNAATRARVSPLNLWPPVPILPVVVRWNALVQRPGPALFGVLQGETDGIDSVDSFSSLTSSLATAGVRMKLKLRPNGTVKALRPVP